MENTIYAITSILSYRWFPVQVNTIFTGDCHSNQHSHHDLYRHGTIQRNYVPSEATEGLLPKSRHEDARWGQNRTYSAKPIQLLFICHHRWRLSEPWSAWSGLRIMHTSHGFSDKKKKQHVMWLSYLRMSVTVISRFCYRDCKTWFWNSSSEVLLFQLNNYFIFFQWLCGVLLWPLQAQCGMHTKWR